MKITSFKAGIVFFTISLLTIGEFQNINAQTAQQLKAAVTSAFTRAFGKENLITENIEKGDATAWRQAVDGIGSYVNKNASKLNTDFNTAQVASEYLLNKLKAIYDQLVKPKVSADRKEKGVTLQASWLKDQKRFASEIETARKRLDWKALDTKKITDWLDMIRKPYLNNVTELQKKLKAMKPGFLGIGGEKEKEVIDVLNYLAVHLESAIEKATITDLNTLKIFAAMG